MKRYFKTILVDRIRTVSQAQETVKLVCTGLYVLGLLGFLELVARLAVDEFIKPGPSFFYLPGAYLLDVLLVLASAFFLGRTKSRTLASAIIIFSASGTVLWIIGPYIDKPEYYFGLNAPFRYSQVIGSVFVALLAYGGLRGTIRYHQLMKGGR